MTISVEESDEDDDEDEDDGEPRTKADNDEKALAGIHVSCFGALMK